MKKFICGFLMGAILFSFVSVYAATQYVAEKATFKVLVNSKEFQGTTGDIFVIEGRTYLPLRDMGEVLGVQVNWNEELKQVEIGTTSTTSLSPSPTPISTSTPMSTPTPTTNPQVLQNLQTQLSYKKNEKATIENRITETENNIRSLEVTLNQHQKSLNDANIKLENTQNEKTVQSLVEKPDGSFQFEYTADPNKIASAQSTVNFYANLVNNYVNLVESANNRLQEYINALELVNNEISNLEDQIKKLK